VPAGATVAIVGPSGAGKTTLANLLLRFWDPAEGHVFIDGVDLRDFELDHLRARVSLVSQDTYLFNDSLRANVALARPDADEAAIYRALDQAALGACAPISDKRGTADYRTKIAGVLARRAAVIAYRRAKERA